MSLRCELNKRLDQLYQRKMMIPRYMDNNYNWAGKNHYSLDMLKDVEMQIEETEAAIKGIDEWLKAKKSKTEEPCKQL